MSFLQLFKPFRPGGDLTVHLAMLVLRLIGIPLGLMGLFDQLIDAAFCLSFLKLQLALLGVIIVVHTHFKTRFLIKTN